ncbi:MAG: hypothetical protein K0V04_07005 [Deltaproteobacteria bacterium]|nr:hypothetical protein [Deltaproteobacteria bacterium]
MTLTLAAALVATNAPVRADAAPRRGSSELERSQAFVSEGDALLEQGEYNEAIAKYRAAYYGLTPEERASYMGSIPIRKGMRAYDLLVAQEQSRAVLERQLALVTEFLESIKNRPDGKAKVGPTIIAELEASRSAVEKKIAAMSEVAAPSTDEPPEDPAPALVEEPAPTQTPTEPDPSPDTRRSDGAIDEPPPSGPSTLGIALAASGGALMAVGAGVLVGNWTVPAQAERFANEEPGYETGTQERVNYIADQDDRARRFLISGSVVLGIGTAVTIGGVVQIIMHRRRSPSNIALAPALSPRHAGLTVRGRF